MQIRRQKRGDPGMPTARGRLMTGFAVVLVLLFVRPIGALCQAPPVQDSYRIAIVLERNEGNSWREIDSRLVLEQNDRVRFRVRTNFNGYLYVTNQSTSGQYAVLFPGPQTGQQNRVESGKDYVVPATEGWFRITGPPGQEIVYWTMSPVALTGTASGTSSRPANTKDAPVLLPRCDDTILRARGDCLDTSAGPKELGDRANLPADLARMPSFKSRELIFIRQQNTSIVSSPVPLSGPVIYEFRLAHR